MVLSKPKHPHCRSPRPSHKLDKDVTTNACRCSHRDAGTYPIPAEKHAFNWLKTSFNRCSHPTSALSVRSCLGITSDQVKVMKTPCEHSQKYQGRRRFAPTLSQRDRRSTMPRSRMWDSMSPSNRGAHVHVIKLSSTLSAERRVCMITTNLVSPSSVVADASRYC